MNVARLQSILRTAGVRAFTVVELLVSISVLALIVLVLYGLFDQVQKALRGNVAQVDVMEGGRAGIRLLTTEMEQMKAGGVANSTNLFIALSAVPSQQTTLDPGTNRFNVLDQVYFQSHFNKSWSGTGYRVLLLDTNGIASQVAEGGVGTLCRYSVQVNDADFPYLPLRTGAAGIPGTNLFWQVMNSPLSKPPTLNLTNYQPVVDGVVHFRVLPYDGNGLLITNNAITNIPSGFRVLSNAFGNDVEFAYSFTNQALPAYLDVQLGILDPHILERYKTYVAPNVAPAVAANYLARQVGAVHLFQVRIPIHTAP